MSTQQRLTGRDRGRKEGLTGPRRKCRKSSGPAEDGTGQVCRGEGGSQRPGSGCRLHSVGNVAWGCGFPLRATLWKLPCGRGATVDAGAVAPQGPKGWLKGKGQAILGTAQPTASTQPPFLSQAGGSFTLRPSARDSCLSLKSSQCASQAPEKQVPLAEIEQTRFVPGTVGSRESRKTPSAE